MSSWQGHCASSLGSCDECTLTVRRRPTVRPSQPSWASCESAYSPTDQHCSSRFARTSVCYHQHSKSRTGSGTKAPKSTAVGCERPHRRVADECATVVLCMLCSHNATSISTTVIIIININLSSLSPSLSLLLLLLLAATSKLLRSLEAAM